jgi:hypothetical protein
MQVLLEVILPVFIVIGFGYVAAWRGLYSAAAVDGLMRFAQGFAIPCLLFAAMATLDLGGGKFRPALMTSFYTGAAAGFLGGFFGARLLFRRPWEDCVAIGFCALFSNSVLLGLAITERAFGMETLQYNFLIVTLHVPFCYGIGLTAMELVRARGTGQSPLRHARTILTAMFSNALLLAILLGLAVNLLGVPVPEVLGDALDLMVRAALPAALFGLGGVLYRYRPEGDAATIAMVCLLSLVVHPAVAYGLGRAFALSTEELRAAVLMASMAPGVNTFLFANMYGVGRRVAASSILIATALSIGTIWVWLAILP